MINLWAFYIVSFFLVIHINVIAQYDSANALSEEYRYDPENVFQQLQESDHLQLEGKEREKYCEHYAFARKELIESGILYPGWTKMERYLNEVMHKIMPDSLKDKHTVHVYPSSLTGVNAYCFGDGSILVNMGMFVTLKNEAALASLLGHELTHYLYGDNQDTYLHQVKKHSLLHRTLPFVERIHHLSHLQYSRAFEKRADSIGMRLAANEGYDLKKANEIFKIYEDWYSHYSERALKDIRKESTHPMAKTRKAIHKRMMKRYKNNEKQYIVNKSLFHELQQESFTKIIQMLWQKMHLISACELSFQYFVLHPENKEFAYLAAESIRRVLVVYPILKQMYFMNHVDGIPNNKKFSILNKIDKVIPEKTLKENGFYQSHFKDVELYTYSDYFKYFVKKAKKYGNIEAILTDALYNSSDSLARQYIKYDEAKHKPYAKAFLNNSLDSSGNKSFLFFDRIHYEKTTASGRYTNYFDMNEQYSKYESQLNKLISKKFPERKLITYNDKAFYSNYHEWMYLMRYTRAIDNFGQKHAKIDLTRLDPRFWELIRKHKLSKIEYLNVKYHNKNRFLPLQIVKYFFLWPVLAPYEAIRNTVQGSQNKKFVYQYHQIDFFDNKPLKMKSEEVGIDLKVPYFTNSMYYLLVNN